MPDQIDLSAMQSIPVKDEQGFVRLHRYWRDPQGEMWDEIWKKTAFRDYWNDALAGKLGGYEEIFFKYLKRGGRQLEAGCGVGQVVLALRARGFDCYGLDFAKDAIEILQKNFPEVPFNWGDIRNLPYDDGFFDGYISLGVIEHFLDGQEGMLKEAARVLKTGGYAFVSVPVLNGYRKLRCKLGTYQTQADMPFFESCLSVEELESLMSKAGFDCVDVVYLNTVMTFAQETLLRPLYKFIEDVRYVRGAVDRVLKLILPKSWFGHMVMIVARKR